MQYRVSKVFMEIGMSNKHLFDFLRKMRYNNHNTFSRKGRGYHAPDF